MGQPTPGPTEPPATTSAEVVLGTSVRPGPKKDKKGASTTSAYFATHDNEVPSGVADIFMVDLIVPVHVCCHCFGKLNPTRGANAASRWLDCGSCSERLVTASRKKRPGSAMGTSLWAYFMTNFFLRKNGREMLATHCRVIALRAQSYDMDPEGWEPIYMQEPGNCTKIFIL